MNPDELKALRKKLGARQKDLAGFLMVSQRTIQNWEQPEGSREHRAIPLEYAKKIHAFADLVRDHKGVRSYRADIVWVPVPVSPKEIDELNHRAECLDIGLTTLIRSALHELISMSLIDLEDKFDKMER